MENCPTSQASTQGLRETQEVASQEIPEGDTEEVWGRLFSVRENVSVCNLTNNSYTFGRGEADYRFSKENLDKIILPAVSKVHFRISREWRDDLDPVVVIEDLSCNGTFVNKVNLGKGNKKLLINNDEVALASPKTKVFVFHNCFENDSDDYPNEVTNKYTMTKVLGQGNFGVVRLAYKQGTLERCAIKIMQKKGSQLQLNNIKQISNEIELLRSVDHPFIISLEDVIDTPEKIYIVMEAAGGGELFDHLVYNGRLPENTAKFYFYQLALAVQYLHSRKITHRDIKPENILLATDEENTRIKLTDFGLSKLAADTSQMTTFCGTISYIAPELIDPNTLSYTNKVDMWSLGVVLYVSLCCYAPFDPEDMKVRYLIKNAIYSFHGKVWNDVSDEAKDLIFKLMVSEPTKRLSIQQTLHHPWLQDKEMENKVKDLLVEDHVSPGKKRRLDSLEENGVEEVNIANAKTPKFQVGITEKL